MIYWATPLQCLLCPMVGVSMQMARDNASDPSSLPLQGIRLALHSSRLLNTREEVCLWGFPRATWFLGGMGHGAIPNATNGATHAQLLGGSSQKLLQSWTGVSGNKSMQILRYLPAAERPDSSYKDASFPPHLQVVTRLLTPFCNTQILNS